MTSHKKTIDVQEIPIAAAITSCTGRIPNVLLNDGADLVTFEFRDDEIVRTIVFELSTGKLTGNIADYEKARSYLYRKAREMKGGSR